VEKITKIVHVLCGFLYDISKANVILKYPASVYMVKIAALEPLKRGTGRNFRISKNFTEANEKFTIKYHTSKLLKFFETTSARTKSTDLTV
jgi:hypothetical protein